MPHTKRRTLKLHHKDASVELPHNKKSVELYGSNVAKALDHHYADVIGEQRRRIYHPQDEGS